MRRITRPIAVAILTLVLVAACGGDAESPGGPGDAAGQGLEPGQMEPLDIDDCSLLTDEEVSAFAGEELVVTQDGPLGCGWVVPGEIIEQFNIRSFRGGGDAATAADVLVNNPQKVIELAGAGDDAVAVSTYDEIINWVIARKGDLFVVINQTFLSFDPTPSELDRSAKLAATALGRLAQAA
jgi:hypothetical protein